MKTVIYTTLERRDEAEDIAFEVVQDYYAEGDAFINMSFLRGKITNIQLVDNEIVIVDGLQINELGEPIAADYAIVDSNISLGSWFCSLSDSVEDGSFEIF